MEGSKDTYFTPEDFHYQDRGMMKWHGFILSDHAEQQVRAAKSRAPVARLAKQSQAEQWEIVQLAMALNKEVSIQLNSLVNGLNQAPLIGKIVSLEAGNLFLQTSHDDQILDIVVDEIHNVQVLSSSKWFDVSDESLY